MDNQRLAFFCGNGMKHEDIVQMNKTARSSGAVGRNAIIPRYIINHPWMHRMKMLDFGAGPKAIHTQALRRQGMDVTPYEIGENAVPGFHLVNWLDNQDAFKLVFASNVVNVQPNMECLEQTLKQMAFFTHPDGLCVFNFPNEPRKMEGLTKKILMEVAGRCFKSVMVENYDGHMIFSCYKYGQDDHEEIEI